LIPITSDPGPHQWLDAISAKPACFILPVGSRVVEPFASFDQHVQADQRPERVLASLVIDYGLVDDERPAMGQA
jgi:hypothetical protein